MIIQKKLSEFDAMKAKLASLGHPVKPQDQAYSAQNDRNSDALSARNESGKNVASSEKGGKPGPRRDASMEQIKKWMSWLIYLIKFVSSICLESLSYLTDWIELPLFLWS